MQEEVTSKAVALSFKGVKLTGTALLKLIKMYQQHRNNPSIPQGKQSVKQLAGQGKGVSTLDMNDEKIKVFHRTMKKYGVDYAVKKNKSTDPPTYTIFFKGKDADAITKAFSEFTDKLTKAKEKPSVLTELRELVAKIKVVNKAKASQTNTKLSQPKID